MTQNEQALEYHLDASTFQRPLGLLAEVLAQKVRREAPKLLRAPLFVAADLHVLIRQTMHTYDLLFYLNADERRQSDCYWRTAYFLFDDNGARINPRIQDMWTALMPVLEVKELYDERYQQLMKDRHMNAE
jgi:hypothetical protein